MSAGSPIATPADGGPLLAIEELSLAFDGYHGTYHALDRVSLTIREGETVGLVGETGCGKSVLAKSVLRLLPESARYPTGAIRWHGGEDIMTMSKRRLRSLRALEVAFVFQDPMTFLDPLFTIGDQLTEIMKTHDSLSGARRTGRQRREAAIALLERMMLPDGARVMASYPHELSGGMRQRVLIAMALSGGAKLLIADEPTTALDVTVQRRILSLIADLVRDLGLSVLLISHDLGVVKTVCRRIAVMYAGRIVEDGPAETVLGAPSHPYTAGLLAAAPRLDAEKRTLASIPGQIPDLLRPPPGCRFAPRCARALDRCRRDVPPLAGPGARAVACHNPVVPA
ncbi:ABC transporter ATP-binding protein [Acuticoccus kandeliae]|uniref:ABC transporter ATP-binding protein n=1 Tax=Acuticoccus kandeliae TaxID=2073160 RepID=UPI000D3E40DE|nr:ABC transporter ATP-binding protein [Acuticoccus kandeliae]